jgi:geranylgeranyl pyrophosphate synthase
VERPLLVGAAIANASAELRATYSGYGLPLGEAFQLRDDILGVFGSQGLTGKSTTSDIREGKITPLMCYALRRTETGELAEILGRGETSEADAARVREILEAVGARSFIEQLIDDYTRAALSAIESQAIPGALREQLAEVASKARQRSS